MNIKKYFSLVLLAACSFAGAQTFTVNNLVINGTVTGPGVTSSLVIKVLNVAALRATSCTSGAMYQTQGYTTAADGGSGLYLCNGSDTTSADNSFTRIAAANTFRYYLQGTNNGYTARQGGAKGDGTTNDLPALQNEIYVLCHSTGSAPGDAGGRLEFDPGKFRVTGTLNVCSGIVLDGQFSGGYPFAGQNSAQQQTSQIICDFGASINQWCIDTLTYASAAGGGGRIAYNAYVNGSIDSAAADGFNSTHDVAIKNLDIVDANGSLQTNVPYGAIRLVGAPNALIENVTINGFGVGIQLNTCFGTKLRNITAQTNYYGLIAYNANNDIVVEGEFDKQIAPSNLTVPAGNIPSWMPNAATFTGASFNMDGSHATSAKGIIIAAANTVNTNGANLTTTVEYWPDAVFLYNSYATDFQFLYAEDTRINYVLSTAYASYNVENLHNFTNSTTWVTDSGYQSNGDINITGNNSSGTNLAQHIWGSAAANDPTYVMFHSSSNALSYYNPSATTVPFPSTQRMNRLYEEGAWTPTIASGTGTLTTASCQPGAYTKVGRLVTLQADCTVTTNGTGSGNIAISGMPYPCHNIISVGSGKAVGVSGKMLVMNTTVGSSSFAVSNFDNTYPASNGERFVMTITYSE